jgi:hypothetical protein
MNNREIPSSGKGFFLSTASKPVLGTIQSLGKGSLSAGVKRPGREAYYEDDYEEFKLLILMIFVNVPRTTFKVLNFEFIIF